MNKKMFGIVVLSCLGLAWPVMGQAPVPTAQQTLPLQGTLADTLTVNTAKHAMTLRFPDLVDKNVDLVATVYQKDGVWEVGPAGVSGRFTPLQADSGPPAPPQKGTVQEVTLTNTEGKLGGKLLIALKSMDYRKKKLYFDATYTISVDLKATGKPVPLADPDPTTPVWRKSAMRPMGEMWMGTFTATRTRGGKLEEGITGDLQAGMVRMAEPGVMGTEGHLLLRPATDGGVTVAADLGTQRMNSSMAGAYMVLPLPKPADLSAYDGLRITVSSAEKRPDLLIGVGLQKANKAWYQADGAGYLPGAKQSFIVPFDVLLHAGGFDDSRWIDTRQVRALRVGVQNPFGVGPVNFTIHSVEAVKWTAVGWQATPAPAQVKVTIDPNTILAHEGQSELPKGLFGFHDVNQNDAKDRDAVLAYTKQLRPSFLRRIEHTGFGGTIKTAEELKALPRVIPETLNIAAERAIAADASDMVMMSYTQNLWAKPSWMTEDLGSFLPKVEASYQAWARGAWMPGDPERGLIRYLEVWNEPFMWARYMNKHDPKMMDPTQFSDIPAEFIAKIYSQIFLAAAKGARSSNPHVQLGGPCSSSFSDDYYSNLTGFVGRVLQDCHAQMDFLTEHHYQGEPKSYAAGYEVTTAYTQNKYQKRWPIFNTEANDLIDTPNKGEKLEDKPFDDGADQLNRAYYNALDILSMAQWVPDIAKGRATHALWSGFCTNKGETDVYTLLADLRGTMLKIAVDQPGVRAVATRQGSDVVVVALNDTRWAQKVQIVLPGVTDNTPVTRTDLTYAAGTQLNTQKGVWGTLAMAPIGSRMLSSWRIHDVYKQSSPQQTENHRRWYLPWVLQQVKAGESITATLPATGIKGDRLYLRLVTRDVQAGEVSVTLNGQTLSLPESTANEGCAIIQTVPISGTEAAGMVELKVSATGNGAEILSCALVAVQAEAPGTK
jgi:hypothetical protein